MTTMLHDRYRVLREAHRVRDALPRNVGGLCAVASARLHTSLKDVGIPSTFLVTDRFCYSHVFLKVPNVEGQDMLLDITVSQFDHQANVEFRPLQDVDTEKSDWWHDPQEVTSTEELLRLQQASGWPKEQLVGATVDLWDLSYPERGIPRCHCRKCRPRHEVRQAHRYAR